MQYHGDLQEIIDSFTENRVMYGPFFDHTASYLSQRGKNPNVFLTSFEELSEVSLSDGLGVLAILPVRLSVCLIVQSVLFIQMSFCLSVCLPACLPACLSVCLFVCLSVDVTSC